MIQLKRSDWRDPDFQQLVAQLDAYLSIIDGDEHAFYTQFNGIDHLQYTVVAYQGEQAVGCGAMKTYGERAMEIKRMFVDPQVRSQGVASMVLQELEAWANELSCPSCVLETGVKQADAVRLYEKNGYQRIPNYGQYQGIENSVCFEKWLAPV